MKQSVERSGKTVDDAIQDALDELNLAIEDAVIEVLDEGEPGGLLGFGRRPARVLVSRADLPDDEATADFPRDEEVMEDDEDASEESSDEESHSGRPTKSAPREDREERSLLNEEEKTQAENQAVDFLTGILIELDIHGRISTYFDEHDTLHIDVDGDDIGAAIGRRGETLEALQYMTSLAINKNREQYLRLALDIGQYRERRSQKLRQQARRSAVRVVRSGRPYVMDPVPPSERRQIHMALSDFKGVVTYSEGREPNRYVVIAPDDER